MTNIIPFVPRVVERAEEEMPQPIKIDWANFTPLFTVNQIEPGGFVEIDGIVPMEIAVLMLKGLEDHKAKRTAAGKAKRVSKKSELVKLNLTRLPRFPGAGRRARSAHEPAMSKGTAGFSMRNAPKAGSRRATRRRRSICQ